MWCSSTVCLKPEDSELRKRKDKIPYFICSWVLAAVFYMQFLISVLLKNYVHIESEAVTDLVYVLLTQLAAVGLPCIAVCVVKKANFKKVFNIKPISVSSVSWCALLGVSLQPVAILLNLPLRTLMYNIKGESFAVVSRPPSGMADIAVMVLVLCLVPAFFEEFLMRGMLLGSVEKYGFFTAVFVTSFMFAVLHNDFSSIIGYLVIGAALAYCVLMTGSVFSAVIAHFSFNAFGVLLDYLMNLYNELAGLGFILLFAAMGLAGAFFSVYKIYAENAENIEESDLYRPLASFLNLPILLILAGYVFKNFI